MVALDDVDRHRCPGVTAQVEEFHGLACRKIGPQGRVRTENDLAHGVVIDRRHTLRRTGSPGERSARQDTRLGDQGGERKGLRWSEAEGRRAGSRRLSRKRTAGRADDQPGDHIAPRGDHRGRDCSRGVRERNQGPVALLLPGPIATGTGDPTMQPGSHWIPEPRRHLEGGLQRQTPPGLARPAAPGDGP